MSAFLCRGEAHEFGSWFGWSLRKDPQTSLSWFVEVIHSHIRMQRAHHFFTSRCRARATVCFACVCASVRCSSRLGVLVLHVTTRCRVRKCMCQLRVWCARSFALGGTARASICSLSGAACKIMCNITVQRPRSCFILQRSARVRLSAYKTLRVALRQAQPYFAFLQQRSASPCHQHQCYAWRPGIPRIPQTGWQTPRAEGKLVLSDTPAKQSCLTLAVADWFVNRGA